MSVRLQAMAIGALPQNAPRVAASLGAFADELWHIAGDRSISTDWYTKRAAVLSVYLATGAPARARARPRAVPSLARGRRAIHADGHLRGPGRHLVRPRGPIRPAAASPVRGPAPPCQGISGQAHD